MQSSATIAYGYLKRVVGIDSGRWRSWTLQDRHPPSYCNRLLHRWHLCFHCCGMVPQACPGPPHQSTVTLGQVVWVSTSWLQRQRPFVAVYHLQTALSDSYSVDNRLSSLEMELLLTPDHRIHNYCCYSDRQFHVLKRGPFRHFWASAKQPTQPRRRPNQLHHPGQSLLKHQSTVHVNEMSVRDSESHVSTYAANFSSLFFQENIIL